MTPLLSFCSQIRTEKIWQPQLQTAFLLFLFLVMNTSLH